MITDYEPSIYISDYNEENTITWEYRCSSKKDVFNAIEYHKKYYSEKHYQPIKVKLIQFCDWVDGKKGIWLVRISNNDSLF